ncbi:MAG: sohB [Francisellaceae bacterium]|nr:sohB [Francisellaceae bacterium]
MSTFLFEYGLFAAKLITFLLAIVASLAFLGIILASRHRERESIEIEKLNDKFEMMQEALENELLTKDELKALAKQRKKEAKEKEKSVKKRIKEEDEALDSRIFVIRFDGDIHASEVDNLREVVTAILSVAEPQDEVLVILESSGGLVHNYGLAASQLQRIRKNNIHLTVAVDLVAASGGYLMAVVANKIIAAPFAVVGSIGVLAELPNFNRLLDKHHIDIEQHTAGEHKTTLTMLGKNTSKAREKFQEELEDTHQLFKQFVQHYRPQLDIDKIATGEHWYGTQAIDLNLIDDIITSDDYLFEKSKNHELFEITYIINESFSEKISNYLQGMSMKLIRTVAHSFQKSSLFK